MKNEKGYIPLVLAFKIAFIAVGVAVVWHIPAWTQAKHNHQEAQYQSSQMFPQQYMEQLPGGDADVQKVEVVKGNGGNFLGGNSGH